MASQLLRRVDSSMTVYNGTGVDIPPNTACAFDAANPPVSPSMPSTRPPGIKITTGAADYVGVTFATIKAGQTGSLQTRGVAIGRAGGDITFGTTLSLMSNASGEFGTRSAGSRTAGIPLHSAATGEEIMFLMEASNAT